MFRTLFLAILSVTLTVNIIFLFATKDKPPDLTGSATLVSVETRAEQDAGPSSSRAPSAGEQPQRRLFLRSNDFYDYSPVAPSGLVGGKEELLFAVENRSQARQLGGPEPRSVSSAPPKQLFETRALTTFAYDNYNNSGVSPANVTIRQTTTRAASLAGRAESDNEITTPTSSSGRPPTSIRLRVKSSRSHVLVSLDDSIIYQSGTGTKLASGGAGGAFRKRRAQAAWRHNANANRPRGRPPPTKRRSSNSPGDGPSSSKHELADDVDALETRNSNNPNQNENNDESERGIHVLVLNQFDASIMSRRLFDTYSSQQDAELALYLSQIKPGRILILAVRDEASFKMAPHSPARKLLKALGSQHIQRLAWRDMWALVTIKRDLFETNNQIGERHDASARTSNSKPLAEAISHSDNFAQWAEEVEIEASVELQARQANDLECPDWPKTQAAARRRSFCSRIEGYGRLCNCQHPSPIEFAPAPIEESRLSNVPIVIIASNRPHYLHRMLRSLLEARGLNASMVTVFIDGFHEEPVEVCKLFQLRYIQHRPQGSRAARISNHYKISLARTFVDLFPQARHAIIFEEDLDVARDALQYFHETLPLLEGDPSLYCVSAWNDQGYEHSVGNLRQLYRVETMPGLGWMLSRELFLHELQPYWPAASQPHDWDMWIRTQAIRKHRECLIPDVSRTYHFGSRGTNINAYFQRQYFSKHAFSGNYLEGKDANTFLLGQNLLGELRGDAYDAMLERIIRHEAKWIGWSTSVSSDAQISINETLKAQMELEYLCSLANLTYYLDSTDEANSKTINSELNIVANNDNDWKLTGAEGGSKTNVIFVKMIDSEDFANWLQLAKCWRLWDLDARGQHKSTWRLYLNGQATLVVGHPASPFGSLKPKALIPFDLRLASASGGGGNDAATAPAA